MKPFKVSITLAAILLIAAGVGFGIAQAGGTHHEDPVLNFEDQEALENAAAACHYEENQPVLSFEDQEAVHTAMVNQGNESCRYQIRRRI